MFISKKDLENLKEEIRAEFGAMMLDNEAGMKAYIDLTLANLEPKPRPKTKKSVE